MAKIDRLGWAAGISVKLFGLKVGIRTLDPLILPFLLSRMPDGWIPLEKAVVDRLYSVVTPTGVRGNVRELCVLYGDHGILSRTQRMEQMIDIFEADLDFYIASNAQDRLFVHAGAVEWKDRAVVIPGKSRTGKTTLVAELLKRGAAYYSDDFVGIDADGNLHPYPRPLSVRKQNGTSARVFPEEFGSAQAQPRPISCVFLIQYLEEASWNARQISRGQGVLSLLENTPSARKHPAFAIHVLQRAIAGADVWRGHRGESGEAINEIQRFLDGGCSGEQPRVGSF